jgi:hypothetical protein
MLSGEFEILSFKLREPPRAGVIVGGGRGINFSLNDLDFGESLSWQDDQGSVVVWFDSAGKEAVIKEHCVTGRHPQGFFENLGWRTKRLWKRWFPN